MYTCGGCKAQFGGLYAFDKHRVGSYHLRQRHCLLSWQMVEAGLHMSGNGIWKQPGNAPHWQTKQNEVIKLEVVHTSYPKPKP